MSIECPIHKVAKKLNPEAVNECQTCEYFNDCLMDMTSDMEDELLQVARKYITELQETVQEHILKKVKKAIE